MEKEINEFVVFCLEYYKERKGLTGKEMYDIFEEYKVFDYLEEMGYRVIKRKEYKTNVHMFIEREV